MGVEMNKNELTERDICTKYILPALKNAGWDEMLQLREEFEISKGRIIVRGRRASCCEPGRYCDVQNAQHQSGEYEAKNSRAILDNQLPNMRPMPFHPAGGATVQDSRPDPKNFANPRTAEKLRGFSGYG